MPVTTYSTKDDLRKGDIRLPARIGDGTGFVEAAAEEIDAALGHLYVTPFVIPDVPENRPARLLLKKVNNLIASGRLILDLAASGEDTELHAYGRTMLKEGLDTLKMIQARDIVLTGAETIKSDADLENPTGPMILNEDDRSLVQGFYEGGAHIAGLGEPYPFGHTYVQPYGGVR